MPSRLRFEVWQEGKSQKWRWRLITNGRVLALSGLYKEKHRAMRATRHLLKVMGKHRQHLLQQPIELVHLDMEEYAPRKVDSTTKNVWKGGSKKKGATPAPPPIPPNFPSLADLASNLLSNNNKK